MGNLPRPPTPRARPRMTLGVVMPLKLALYIDRVNVVSAKESRPSGDGLPSLYLSA